MDVGKRIFRKYRNYQQMLVVAVAAVAVVVTLAVKLTVAVVVLLLRFSVGCAMNHLSKRKNNNNNRTNHLIQHRIVFYWMCDMESTDCDDAIFLSSQQLYQHGVGVSDRKNRWLGRMYLHRS